VADKGGAAPMRELGAAPSPFSAGLRLRCPRCGEGPLFAGLLAVRESCAVCGLDLRAQDSGDGPAVFVIFILGFVAMAFAVFVELNFEPPLWAHALIWPVFVLGAAIALLRPFKATLIALQYRHRRADFDVGE
jgi:uncharacterized protein (DUF983 family)